MAFTKYTASATYIYIYKTKYLSAYNFVAEHSKHMDWLITNRVMMAGKGYQPLLGKNPQLSQDLRQKPQVFSGTRWGKKWRDPCVC